jgi:hypothetical protein
MSILGLLVLIIIVGVALWASRALMAAFAIGDPLRTVIYVLVMIVLLILVLNSLGLNTGIRLHL